MDWSGLTARVYDAMNPPGWSFGDIDFYAETLEGPTLIAPCGNGRVLIPLLQCGIDADGMDATPDMLGHCRSHLKSHGLQTTLFQQTYGEFAGHRLYQSILCPTSSIMMVEPEEAIAGISRFFDALLPGGRLWLDTHMPPYSEPGPASSVEIDGETWALTATPELIDPQNQTAHQSMIFTSPRETIVSPVFWRWWEIAEMTRALRGAGFDAVRVLYDYQDRPREGCRCITYEAQRG